MTIRVTDSEYPNADEIVKQSIEDAGGHEAWWNQGAGMDEGFRRFNQEREVLLEKYTYKWVAVSPDGLLGVYDTIDEALDTLDALGLGRDDYFLKYLDPMPIIPANFDIRLLDTIREITAGWDEATNSSSS